MVGKVESQSVILLVGLVTLVAGIFITKDECGPNEEYQLCGSSCPFNCSNPEGPITCSNECVEGCFCKSGFLKNETGACVSADQCIGTGSNTICAADEEFLSCGTACALTCAQPERALCGLACSMGCFCKAGFVRDAAGTCVTPDKCPGDQCLNQNEVYDMCNKGCEPSCADPEPICVKMCTGGCVCAPGLLRDPSGSCVAVDKCPPSNSTDINLLGRYMSVINRILDMSV